ncbi:MAG: hypothetical protein LH606_09975 [Cytophagaceae bacterium]|nr:hypothetical protein [Cytophagaceae bacterium]
MFTLKIMAFVAIGILAFLAVAWVVMRLWNWLVPGAFNGPRLQYKYALGLLLLSRILFGGFGGFRGHGPQGHGGPGGHWNRDGRHHHETSIKPHQQSLTPETQVTPQP